MQLSCRSSSNSNLVQHVPYFIGVAERTASSMASSRLPKSHSAWDLVDYGTL